MPNLFQDIPLDLTEEQLETITSGRSVRIERIVSNGHATPEDEWYDQDQNEWVLILKGRGDIEFEDGRSIRLRKGDHCLISPHERHRVTHTDPHTLWLAVHFD